MDKELTYIKAGDYYIPNLALAPRTGGAGQGHWQVWPHEIDLLEAAPAQAVLGIGVYRQAPGAPAGH